MLLTIFTPIFNRAYTIHRLYESLCRQTNKNFEWLVIDDGSTDNVSDIIQEYAEKGIIDIIFHRQKNSGKHIAINNGVKLARGKYFYIVDSDDYIPDDAVDFIITQISYIDQEPQFAGIVGTDMTTSGNLLSYLPTETYIDATSLEVRYKYCVSGDMAEVVRTDILRKFPFPSIKGEKYSAESVVWNRIAKDGYQFRFFPNILKIIKYLPDGLSASIVRLRMDSPVTATICYSELLEMDIPFKQRIKAAINYWRFWFCHSEEKKPRIGYQWLCFSPLGLLIHFKDRWVL